MFGRFRRNREQAVEALPVSASGADPHPPQASAAALAEIALSCGASDTHSVSALADPIATARAVKAAIRAGKRDAGEVARLVVAEIQGDPIDLYWTHAEMRAWIDRTVERHCIDISAIKPAHLIAAIKAHPAVTYGEKRIRDDQRFEGLRRRLAIARKGMPEHRRIPPKCWFFTVADNGQAMFDAPEHVSAAVIAKHFEEEAARAARAATPNTALNAASVRPDDPAASPLRSPVSPGRSPAVQSGLATGVRAGVRVGVVPESGVESVGFVVGSERPVTLRRASG